MFSPTSSAVAAAADTVGVGVGLVDLLLESPPTALRMLLIIVKGVKCPSPCCIERVKEKINFKVQLILFLT